MEKESQYSEVNSLHADISRLINSVNEFIKQQPRRQQNVAPVCEMTDNNTNNETEVPARENQQNFELPTENITSVDISDSDEEIDSEQEQDVEWSSVAPILQRHISDLEALETMNKATSTLIRRVKKLTIAKSMRLMRGPDYDPSQENKE